MALHRGTFSDEGENVAFGDALELEPKTERSSISSEGEERILLC